MSLHHRREVADMRGAYSHDKRTAQVHVYSSDSDSECHLSSTSGTSSQTAPTSYSSSPPKKAAVVWHDAGEKRHRQSPERYFEDREPQSSPVSSVQTYASSEQSEEQEQEERLPEYDVPEYTAAPYQPSAVPTTSHQFSELFPSHRRLTVRHDDSTLDGNMNLRLDTQLSSYGQKYDMTLFHLRMHDLKNREFSLRRYCRDSGREVCHSVRKNQKSAAAKRPAFQRSLSNALHSMRPNSSHRNSTGPGSLKRTDSGYGSMQSVDFDDYDRPRSTGQDAKPVEESPSNTIKLEFSNYAQVDVTRTGNSNHKRHEFEYWGDRYAWKRVSRSDHGSNEVSFHLTKSGADYVLAYVIPITLSPSEAQEEQRKGGWIPPCSMWIADKEIVNSQKKDLADVIIATGLIALVDDSIHTRFLSKNEKQLLIPIPKFGVEYVGPKRLVNEMFNRKENNPSDKSRPSSSSRPSTANEGAKGSRTHTGPVRH